MGALLFVHPDRRWCEQIKKQAQDRMGINTIFYHSFGDALEVIGNGAIPISAFYFSVKDQNSSVFSALDFCLANRPVTPVFLIHQVQEPFLKTINVTGAFGPEACLSDLLQPLRSESLHEPSWVEVRPVGVRQHSDYIAVPTMDFQYSLHYPEDVFIHHQDGQMKLFASKGSPVELGYLQQAMKFSNWLHIRESRYRDLREHLKQGKAFYLDLYGISEEWIRSELLVEGKLILSRIRSSMPSDPVVTRAISFLHHFFCHLTKLTRSPDSKILHSFLDAAEKTDRTLHALALALLICGYFRFEKAAIVEIFGIACLLQDISLIHSPFGNLADLPSCQIPPEARNFYFRHPAHSADLLASSTGLSAATLQVVRQHHETKDRKGFPNRIGGSQLHPMAEALSLIGQYLELREKLLSKKELQDQMIREVYPHYSVEMVRAFESVLFKLPEFTKKE